MASSLEFVDYICEQLRGTGALRSKKMFGEYMVYLNDKPVFLVCDDTLFIKMLPCLEPLLGGHAMAAPYQGAKDHYVLDPDNRELLCQVAALAEPVIPVPKPKKKKTQPHG